MHLDLIGSYIKSIIQQQPGDATIKNGVSLACMTMIDRVTGWFEIVEVLTFDVNELIGSNH